MIKFVKQKNDFSCAPIAILNALKWANPKKSYPYSFYYKRLVIDCKTDRDGTAAKDMKRALQNQADLNVKELKRFNKAAIVKHLRFGGGVILGHFEMPHPGKDDLEGHYSFWHLDSKQRLVGVNALRKEFQTSTEWDLDILQFLEVHTQANLGEGLEIYLVFPKNVKY